MAPDVLRGGALRYSGSSASFLFQRLHPGVLLTAARGRDIGEFGDAPLAVVEREHRLFRRGVAWYFDASMVENAATAVADQWARWFRRNAGLVERLHVLTGTDAANLTVQIARHFAGAQSLIAVHTDRADWARYLPPEHRLHRLLSRFDEPAVSAARVEGAGRVRLSSASCGWLFRRLGPDALLSEFSGSDSGELTDMAFEELDRELTRSRGGLVWFLDLRRAESVAPEVSRAWTEWLGANRDRITRINAFAPSALFTMVLTVAGYLSGTAGLFRIHRQPAAFENEMASFATSLAA